MEWHCGLSKAGVGPELCLPDAAPNNHGTWDYQRRWSYRFTQLVCRWEINSVLSLKWIETTKILSYWIAHVASIWLPSAPETIAMAAWRYCGLCQVGSPRSKLKLPAISMPLHHCTTSHLVLHQSGAVLRRVKITLYPINYRTSLWIATPLQICYPSRHSPITPPFASPTSRGRRIGRILKSRHSQIARPSCSSKGQSRRAYPRPSASRSYCFAS